MMLGQDEREGGMEGRREGSLKVRGQSYPTMATFLHYPYQRSRDQSCMANLSVNQTLPFSYCSYLQCPQSYHGNSVLR